MIAVAKPAAVAAAADYFDDPSATWVASMDPNWRSPDFDRTIDCCALDCNCQPLAVSMAMSYRLTREKNNIKLPFA